MMPRFTEAGADDAARDALALIRAMLQGDTAAASVVAANMTWPHLTAMIAARWLADFITEQGTAPEDALARLDAWQRGAGLS